MNTTNILRTTGRAAMALAFWAVQAAVAGTPSVMTGGDADWTEESAGCWRSGAIGDNQSSWIEFAVDNAPCGVSFRWKTSSEDGYDKLHCYLDGTEAMPALSGEMDDWEDGALLVTGSDSPAIRFEYVKDSSASGGDDCGWVKDVATFAIPVRTLALDANGGSADPPEITVADGYAVGALPDAVWTGEGKFRFLGWFTEKDGDEQVTADSVCQEEWTTLFAQWMELHPPENDDFADAVVISGAAGSVEGSTIDSTRETPDLIPDEFDYEYSSTVWYKWTAPEDGTYVFTAEDAAGERRWGAVVGVTTGYDEDKEPWSDIDVNERQIRVQAIKGGTYWIEVGSSHSDEFEFTLSWMELHPPANDDFADAVAISGATGSVKGSTVDSTREVPDLIPVEYHYDYSSTVWYKWTAPGDGIYVFTVADADEEQGRSAVVGMTTGYDEDEESWSDSHVAWRRLRLQAIKGGTYWIEVGSYTGEEFNFTLSWREFNPPANDHISDATEISGSAGSIEGTTIDSTQEGVDLIPDEHHSYYGLTVWYKWTAPEDGTYAFTVADVEEWSIVIGVTTGYDEEEGTWSGADFNGPRMPVQAIKGTMYWIEVGSYIGEESDFTLSWKKVNTPANDNFAGATEISGGTGSIDGTTIDSTREANDLIPDEYYSSYASTVWYKWTAPGDGTYAFTVTDADAEERSAFVGVTTGYDEEEETWSDTVISWQRNVFSAIGGVTYWIEVGSNLGEELDFTLVWEKPYAPANDDFAGAEEISGTAGRIPGATIGSTREAADLIPDWYGDYYTSTVWYKWTAPEDGFYAFTAADVDEERGWGAAVGVTTGYDEVEETWSNANVRWRRISIQAIKGTTYWIEVGSLSGEVIDFTLSWEQVTPPANDNFAGAKEISGAAGSVEGTTIVSTQETADLIPSWYGSDDYATVWYKWTAPEDGSYAFSVADVDEERGWDAAVGVTTGYDEAKEAWADADVRWKRISIQAIKGTTYWIEVGTLSGKEFDFTLSWEQVTPPANDNFAAAKEISGAAGNVEGSTIDSTREATDLIPDRYGSPYKFTVWYKWTAPEDGRYAFTIANAVVGVTTGYDEEKGDWSDADVNREQILVRAIKGTTYWIEVGSYPGEEIDFTLSWESFTPPANDNFADAISIEGVSGNTTGSNLGASVEEGEPLPLETEDGWTFDTAASVWWRWQAPENGSFSVSTEGSDFDTVLGVYTGTAVDGLATVAANDEEYANAGTSLVTFDATAGSVYYFAVGGYASRIGHIVLSWERVGDTGDDVVDAGNGKTVTVPGAWLAENTTRAATDWAANGRLRVWQCYVLGLDPESMEDFRIVSFPVNDDGTPDLEHIGVHPDPATWNVPATLRLQGAATLDGPWNDVPGDGDAEYRFFAAGVVLP